MPSADLRIADLPEDLREEGERLRGQYFALLEDAGFLSEDGAVDLGCLSDIQRVKSANLDTLRKISATAQELADLDSIRKFQPEHAKLQETYRRAWPLLVYGSRAFGEEAMEHLSTRIEWAQVQTLIEQSCGLMGLERCTVNGIVGLTVDGALNLDDLPSLTAIPEGLYVRGYLTLRRCSALTVVPADIETQGDLLLGLCTALVTIRNGLRVCGDLNLDFCSALHDLPDDMTVGGDIYVRGCSPQIQLQAHALKRRGQIGENVITN